MSGKYCDSLGGQRGPDAVSFTFRGPEISVIHGVVRQDGSARVFIDGEWQRALSFWGTQPGMQFLQQQTYRRLGRGEHTVRIEMRRKTGFLEGFVYGGWLSVPAT